VHWYNDDHMHSAIRFVSPSDRHDGRDREILCKRHDLYLQARERNPRRWSGKTRNLTRVELVTLNPEREKAVSSAFDKQRLAA
jgi:putative transposase